VWVDGYWDADRPGYVYQPGYWDYYGTGWRWNTGIWIVGRPGYYYTPRYYDYGRHVYVGGTWGTRPYYGHSYYSRPSYYTPASRVYTTPGRGYAAPTRVYSTPHYGGGYGGGVRVRDHRR
jgi:hypothetical protein